MTAFLVALVCVAIILAISWLITCGIIALICMCFNLTFSWLTATGIWLVMLLLKQVFSITVKK